jgi:hypothetical protein
MPFVRRAAAIEILPAARIPARSLDLSKARLTAKRADLQRRAHTSAMGHFETKSDALSLRVYWSGPPTCSYVVPSTGP